MMEELDDALPLGGVASWRLGYKKHIHTYISIINKWKLLEILRNFGTLLWSAASNIS